MKGKKFRYIDINLGDTVLLNDDSDWDITFKTPNKKKMRNRYGFFNFLGVTQGMVRRDFEDIVYLKDIVKILD